MNYLLVVARKFINSDLTTLETFTASLEASVSDDVVYDFESDKDFDTILSEADDALDSQFYYTLVLADGTEDSPIPNSLYANSSYINSFCRDRLKNQSESDGLGSLLMTSISRSQGIENHLKMKST
jgi:hypothetical protein